MNRLGTQQESCIEIDHHFFFADLQARYWGLLFENLRRAVDEIYQTCETDESVEECKEAIMVYNYIIINDNKLHKNQLSNDFDDIIFVYTRYINLSQIISV